MSTDICTFSGTGNSLHVARELQRRLTNPNLVPIVRLLRQETIETGADTVGLVVAPAIAPALMPINGLLWLVWWLLIGAGLLRLARSVRLDQT